MAKLEIKEIWADSGETIKREMTANELTQYQVDQTNLADRKALNSTAAQAKAALLEKLGITADEAALLLS